MRSTYLDLGGNVRKNPKLSGTTHNVFGIQVGVSINLLIRKSEQNRRSHKLSIFYARVVEKFWRKEEKYRYLDAKEQYSKIDWKPISTRQTAHVANRRPSTSEFESFIPIGRRGSKAGKRARPKAYVIFKAS